MTFSAQDMEQLKAAKALFARLSKEAAGWSAEWVDEKRIASRDGNDTAADTAADNAFQFNELAGVLDDMAISVQQILDDWMPGLDKVTAEYEKRGVRYGWTKEDFELDRADTMREAV